MTRSAWVAHTHLFNGAVVHVDGATDVATIRLRFSDDVETDAELLADGATVLAVEAHTTAAGTAIPARVWSVSESRREQGTLLLRLGSRLPS